MAAFFQLTWRRLGEEKYSSIFNTSPRMEMLEIRKLVYSGFENQSRLEMNLSCGGLFVAGYPGKLNFERNCI